MEFHLAVGMLGSGSEASSNSDFNSESCDEGKEDHHNPYLDSDVEDHSEDDAQDDAESGFSLPAQTHIVTFKCMGTTYNIHYQEHLKEASKLLAKKEPVPVKLVPEPTNEYDSKAIAFYCKINQEWHKIGYVVKEVLDHVHEALASKRIIFIKFSWVKYLVIWSRCLPGYYAGINIALNGEWHKDVTK